MADSWRLLDYLSANGRNQIHEWLDSLPPKAKAAVNTRLRFVEVTRPLGGKLSTVLKGDHEGIFEIRIPHNKVQYRPLCCYGPGMDDITLLVGAIEQGDRFKPKNAPELAEERRRDIHKEGHTCEHNFR